MRGLVLGGVIAGVLGVEWGALGADPVAIRGVMVDARTGAAVAGVSVAVSDGAGRSIEVVSNRRGEFAIIGLSFGAIGVELVRGGRSDEQLLCRVPSGRSAHVRILLIEPGNAVSPDSTCGLDPDTSDRYIIQ